MTVQRQTIARGTKISIGTVAGGTVALFGRTEEFQLPTQEYEVLEAPELDPQTDAGAPLDADVPQLGDEIFGEFEFTHYWDPRHADATAIDGWFAGKNDLIFQFDTPHATGGARITFNGKIKKLQPAKAVKKEFFKRTVTCIRTSGITNANKPA